MKKERIWWWMAALLSLTLAVFGFYRRKRKKDLVTDTQMSTSISAASSSISPTYVSTPNIAEIVTSPANLTGVAPSGAKWGINTLTGQTFLVDSTGHWQVIATNSVVPTTAVFTPPALQNGQTLIEDVTVAGIELSTHYSLAILTPLVSYEGIDIVMMVVANNTVRVTISNETGDILTLSALTLSALPLN